MRAPLGERFDGQIDSQGTVRGRMTAGCSYQLVWQEAPASGTAFDGDYVGVSREGSGVGCPPNANGVPSAASVTMIIRNSVVMGGGWQGTVSPQGLVTLRNDTLGIQINGQIDGQGSMRGERRSTTGCVFTYVWRKRFG